MPHGHILVWSPVTLFDRLGAPGRCGTHADEHGLNRLRDEKPYMESAQRMSGLSFAVPFGSGNI